MAQGANINNLRSEDLNGLSVRLPLLSEQRRIARVLDAADALCTKRRESIACLDTLVQSTFLDMFGDPASNDMSWEIVRLDEEVEALEGGKNVAEADGETPFRVLKVSAVTSGTYRPDQSKYLPADFLVPEAYKVRDGDLLISRANTQELVGATAYVWSTPPNMVLPDKIWRIRWKSDSKMEPLFLSALSRERNFRTILSERATGTSGSMRNIAKPKLMSMPIIRPPLPLQRKFVTIVRSIEAQKSHLRAHLTELDTLFASLQSRAFAGEL